MISDSGHRVPLWAVECDRCGKPDEVTADTEADALDDMVGIVGRGWEQRSDDLWCSTCVREASEPAEVLAREAAYEVGR